MPFLRLTRDRRGYENTFLLHAVHPGERPRVLYWYRSAPGVRVGRSALDEDAIRTIEEQHPDVDFDWPQILEVGAASAPEVERTPIPRPRRKPVRPREEYPTPADAAATGDAADTDTVAVDLAADAPDALDDGDDETPLVDVDVLSEVRSPRAHDVLEELVGREIATRLRARYAEMSARLHQVPALDPRRDAWRRRAEALDPDTWVTPEEILHGVRHADELFDALRRELLS